MKLKPLFIPLKSEYFRAFEDGSKTVEWRKIGRNFSERTLLIGRRVCLSNGYSGAQLIGEIVHLEFRSAQFVPGALAIYPRGTLLAGIHIKLRQRQSTPPRARPRRSTPGRTS